MAAACCGSRLAVRQHILSLCDHEDGWHHAGRPVNLVKEQFAPSPGSCPEPIARDGGGAPPKPDHFYLLPAARFLPAACLSIAACFSIAALNSGVGSSTAITPSPRSLKASCYFLSEQKCAPLNSCFIPAPSLHKLWVCR